MTWIMFLKNDSDYCVEDTWAKRKSGISVSVLRVLGNEYSGMEMLRDWVFVSAVYVKDQM